MSKSDRTVSFRVEDELVDRIDSKLDYGDKRSVWIREAIRQRLDRVEEGQSGDRGRESEDTSTRDHDDITLTQQKAEEFDDMYERAMERVDEEWDLPEDMEIPSRAIISGGVPGGLELRISWEVVKKALDDELDESIDAGDLDASGYVIDSAGGRAN